MQQVEHARLSRQCQAIVTRLKKGDATNSELAQIALKYTSRISDLRAKGWVVNVVAKDHATGLTTYRLHAAEATQLELL